MLFFSQKNGLRHVYCLRLNPGARGEHLAIQLSWMDPWLLVKRVCPVHLVERWGCSPGLWLWQLINFLIGFVIRAGSIVDISPGSNRWSPSSIPQRRQKIIVLLPWEWLVQMMGEIMRFCIDDVRWILQNGRVWGCRNGRAEVSEGTAEYGCDSLLMPVCGSVGGRGTSWSKMAYYGNILLKTNAGEREPEVEGLI